MGELPRGVMWINLEPIIENEDGGYHLTPLEVFRWSREKRVGRIYKTDESIVSAPNEVVLLGAICELTAKIELLEKSTKKSYSLETHREFLRDWHDRYNAASKSLGKVIHRIELLLSGHTCNTKERVIYRASRLLSCRERWHYLFSKNEYSVMWGQEKKIQEISKLKFAELKDLLSIPEIGKGTIEKFSKCDCSTGKANP